MILDHDITSSEELKKLIENKELKFVDAFVYRCQKCGAYVAKRVTNMSNKDKEKFYVLWCQKCKNKVELLTKKHFSSISPLTHNRCFSLPLHYNI